MISKRLLSVAKFISKNDKVCDVGCDHGLLSIYLYENNLCESIIASDININALSNAINNINKYGYDIKTYVSDGIDNIPLEDIDTLIISGMGTSTILHILKEDKLANIKKIVIQSNNEHEKMRSEMNKKGYYLQMDDVVYDNNKYYETMCFIKDSKHNTLEEIEFGLISDSKNSYFKFLLSKYNEILEKIPEDNESRNEIINKIEKLKLL